MKKFTINRYEHKNLVKIEISDKFPETGEENRYMMTLTPIARS